MANWLAPKRRWAVGLARLGWPLVLATASIMAYAQSTDRAQVNPLRQPAAADPETLARGRLPRVGDTWTYSLTELHPQSRKLVDSVYIVRVRAASDKTVVDEVSRDGSTPVESTHSPGRYMVEQVVSVFSPYLVVFEDLKPGDRIWRVTEHDDFCYVWMQCSTEGRVEARETLWLPAGTFDTIKVTLVQYFRTRQGGPYAALNSRTSRELTIWYSPQLKRAVKVTSRISRGLATPFHATFNLELVSHALQ